MNSAYLLTLKRLFWLRALYIFLQIYIVIQLHGILNVALPLDLILTIIYVYLALNIIVYFRLRFIPIATQFEIFIHLLVDILEFSALIYFTGGASNPFIFLLLVPVAIATTQLRQSYSWLLALCGASVYFMSIFYHYPLPSPPNTIIDKTLAHSIAAFFSYVSGAGIIIIIINMGRSSTIKQEQSNLRLRNQIQRNESIVAMSTLTASLAHDLGTPLSTVTLILDELESNTHLNESSLADIRLAREQIFLCKDNLATSINHSNASELLDFKKMSLRTFTDHLASHLHERRPEITLEQNILSDETFTVSSNRLIELSLANLLDNAADASLENNNNQIEFSAEIQKNLLVVNITDHGKGIDLNSTSELGQIIKTTKAHGHGAGLVLSNATLDIYDGKLTLMNTETGGTRAHIEIPLKQAE